jgi:GTPase SAR1 family protein
MEYLLHLFSLSNQETLSDELFSEFKETAHNSSDIFSELILPFINFEPITIRIGLLGLSGVGKTCFLNLLKGKKDLNYRATLGSYLNFNNTYEIEYNNTLVNTKIIFHDFSAVERYMVYPSENPNFHNFDIVALMFDNKSSYTDGKKWQKQIMKKFSCYRSLRIKNKIDINDSTLDKNELKISVKRKIGIESVLDEIVKIYNK